MRQLFITDMDGTLLSTDGRVTPESAHSITQLTRRGALITVATARTPATVEPLLRSVATSPPAIVLTGAALWCRATHRFINPHMMNDATACRITSLLRDSVICPMTYTLRPDCSAIEMYVHGTLSAKERKFIDERMRLPYKRINLMEQTPAPSFYPRTILIFAMGPIDTVNGVATTLRNEVECSVSAYPDIYNRQLGLIEIFAPGVSKATAVNELRSLCHADEVTVFGDNLNDIPMMEVADVAVAMANALPQVKEVASTMIGPNSTDAVARYIMEHYRGR